MAMEAASKMQWLVHMLPDAGRYPFLHDTTCQQTLSKDRTLLLLLKRYILGKTLGEASEEHQPIGRVVARSSWQHWSWDATCGCLLRILHDPPRHALCARSDVMERTLWHDVSEVELLTRFRRWRTSSAEALCVGFHRPSSFAVNTAPRFHATSKFPSLKD